MSLQRAKNGGNSAIISTFKKFVNVFIQKNKSETLILSLDI